MVRISELAEQAGLSVATVKYYLREGLLPPGRPLARTQSDYDVEHLSRLRLLRILREVGDVPVGRLRELVAAVESVDLSRHGMLAAAADAVAPPPPPAGPRRTEARAMADEVVAAAGWDRVRPDAPDRENLAAVLEVVASAEAWSRSGEVWSRSGEGLHPYVEAADRLARWEVGELEDSGAAAVMQQMVVGQVVFGEVLATLRRLAEEHYSAERFEPRERTTARRSSRRAPGVSG